MVYAEQNAAFLADKKLFFKQVSTDKEMQERIAETDHDAKHKDYGFLLQNQIALEAEFVQMFAVLKTQKDKNNEAFWMYCYYCASLLEAFYKAYAQQSKEATYKKLKQEIKARLLNEKAEKESEENFIRSLENSFTNSFRNLMKVPFHLSVLRDYVAYSNLTRLYWVFCRLTLTNGLALANTLQFIEKLDAVLGTHTNVDNIISVFQAPNGVLNYFSVGLFLMRFAIDAALLTRHTFFPTEEEKKLNTSAYERFKYEVYKRHCNFANDLVWATVNFITNFNEVTHIPGPVAGAITAVFLGFDVCMLLYKSYLAKQEYLVKKAQYLKEREELTLLLQGEKLSDKERLRHETQVDILNKQLTELEIEWRTKEATLHFAASAAAFVMLGFSATLIFTTPGMIVASFFICHLAIAMYFSTNAYAKYQEKSLRLEQAELLGDNLLVARKEFEAARNDFIFTMVKNTVVPMVLITTFAIYWPAAVILTAVYLGYELYHAYDQHNSSKEAQHLALNSPPIDDLILEHETVGIAR